MEISVCLYSACATVKSTMHCLYTKPCDMHVKNSHMLRVRSHNTFYCVDIKTLVDLVDYKLVLYLITWESTVCNHDICC